MTFGRDEADAINAAIRELCGYAPSTFIRVSERAAYRAGLLAAWRAVNSQIKEGDLGGNGCDLNAQRNGTVLAANSIAAITGCDIEWPEETPGAN